METQYRDNTRESGLDEEKTKEELGMSQVSIEIMGVDVLYK